MRITMYPPPPRLPASGYVTARANPTATAASTALPPCFMTSAPTLEARGSSLATIACAANCGRAPARKGHPLGNTAGTRAGMAGPPDCWNGAAAAIPIETTPTAPTRPDLFFSRVLPEDDALFYACPGVRVAIGAPS